MAAFECGVCVGASATHRRGLFATRAFAEGEVVLREKPLVAMQDCLVSVLKCHTDDSCARCHTLAIAPLRTAERNLRLSLARVSLARFAKRAAILAR